MVACNRENRLKPAYPQFHYQCLHGWSHTQCRKVATSKSQLWSLKLFWIIKYFLNISFQVRMVLEKHPYSSVLVLFLLISLGGQCEGAHMCAGNCLSVTPGLSFYLAFSVTSLACCFPIRLAGHWVPGTCVSPSLQL